MNEDKGARYHRLRRRSSVGGLVIAGALLASLLLSGASAAIREVCSRFGGAPAEAPLTVALFVVALGVLQAAIAFPLAYYEGFVLERRYGLSATARAEWLKDHIKGVMLSGALALLVAEVVYSTIRFWPGGWWAVSALLLTGGIALLARVAPVVLLPIFYRFKPLENPALQSRLASLSSRAGVALLGVYEWGLGDKSRRANAALVGSGGTRRVLLSDTLLAEYSEDEIEVILAHELGHHANRDMTKGLALESLLIASSLAVAAGVLATSWQALGLTGPADAAGVPLLTLSAGAVMVAFTPVVNAVSRRNERRADRYALELTGLHGAFVSAMRRLSVQNLAEPNPSRATVWLFHTHPPIDQRIAAARALADR